MGIERLCRQVGEVQGCHGKNKMVLPHALERQDMSHMNRAVCMKEVGVSLFLPAITLLCPGPRIPKSPWCMNNQRLVSQATR